jgi:arginine N-succinyltransferase
VHVFRPIRDDDLPRLVALARSIDGSLTSLPPDEAFLRERIDDSLRAFSPHVRKPGGECYLFVLEDTTSGEVIGTSGIVARVGGYDPFYSYEIRTEQFTHAPLNIAKEVGVLHLKQLHAGPTEIGSLFLHADRRRGGWGRFLSLARFLFIGAFRSRFDATVVAELRGYMDQRGQSPFWEAVGRKFFEHDFYEADLLSGLGNKQFIADLMPRHPIYIPLLPAEVQAVIGRPHHDAVPALVLLQAEGFAATAEVDIFDAGPQVRATVSNIRTIRQSRGAAVAEITSAPADTPPMLVARRSLDFRCVLAPVRVVGEDAVALGADAAAALGVSTGDTVSFAPPR